MEPKRKKPTYPAPSAVAVLYESDAYHACLARRPVSPGGRDTVGINGRQVAGAGFLEALIGKGICPRTYAVVRNQRNAEAFDRYCQTLPIELRVSRAPKLISLESETQAFFTNPPAPILHLPNVLESAFAWARRHADNRSLALSGITHGLNGSRIMQLIADLVTAPYESYDALVCTSRAAEQLVRRVSASYADYLKERFGGDFRLPIRLEIIPLGVDVEKLRPPNPAEKSQARQRLGLDPEAIVVLMVGRLEFHAKVHPFPLYQGLSMAAERTGKKIQLVLYGSSGNESLLNAFREGAALFCQSVTVTFLDGSRADFVPAVWHAADIYTSLADNTQETFGLSIVEAMAYGLPVIASDWDGCRDTVVPGETGFLVPARMIRGATAHTTLRHALEITHVGELLAECNQATVIDIADCADAFQILIEEPQARQRMGLAGRLHVEKKFSWDRTIRAFEALWSEQESECRQISQAESPPNRAFGPAWFSAPEIAFAGYPSEWLDDTNRVATTPHAVLKLPRLIASALTNYVPFTRTTELRILEMILNLGKAGCTLGEIDELLKREGLTFAKGRGTVAWMLKYGLLSPFPPSSTTSTNIGESRPQT